MAIVLLLSNQAWIPRGAIGGSVANKGQPLPSIRTLRTVSPSEAWAHEARDFTPRLLERPATLWTELGVLLELEGMKQSIGDYYADIVAHYPHDDRIVLIENQ